jgi:hypothetical protein
MISGKSLIPEKANERSTSENTRWDIYLELPGTRILHAHPWQDIAIPDISDGAELDHRREVYEYSLGFP